MESSSIAGAMLLMKTAQTQQAMSTTLIKMASDRQNQMVNLLAQNSLPTSQPAPEETNFVFSTYA